LTLAACALLAMAALLAGCGGAGAASDGSSGHLTLTCSSVIAPTGIDVVSARLLCQVSGAPASATSFSLTYHVTNPDARGFPFGATCAAPLHRGAGTCVQVYSAPVPAPVSPATVSGYVEPGHIAIGPVTPKETQATPKPGQPLGG
jgi:hypothetical protein